MTFRLHFCTLYATPMAVWLNFRLRLCILYAKPHDWLSEFASIVLHHSKLTSHTDMGQEKSLHVATLYRKKIARRSWQYDVDSWYSTFMTILHATEYRVSTELKLFEKRTKSWFRGLHHGAAPTARPCS